jgi:hypothetical protein
VQIYGTASWQAVNGVLKDVNEMLNASQAVLTLNLLAGQYLLDNVDV